MKGDFIYHLFNKEHSELTIADIKIFFESSREETSILEFKSGEVEIIDLYKEITAFLNTEGGLIIVGAPRESKTKIGKKELTTCQGDLTYSNFRSKDWLHQKISSNIFPVPTNIFIKELGSTEGTVFLIDIPQSVRPPHQSNADGRYYIRMECEAKPAPHGLVQALFDKRRSPVLTADLEIISSNLDLTEITVSFRNESEVPADKVSFLIDIYNINSIDSRWNFRELTIL